LAVIVESSEDAIYSKDVDGIITSWNRGAERLYGYTAEEVVGKPVAIIVPSDQADQLPGIMERLKRGERVERYETVRVCKDGRRVDVSLGVSPMWNGSGKMLGVSVIAQDITARKRAEADVVRLNKELRDRLDEWQAVLNMVPVGIGIAHDPGCRRITLNPYISELLGVPAWENASLSAPEDERPATYAIHRDGKELPPEQLPMQLACSGVEVRDFECDLVRHDQPPVRLTCSALPLRDTEGRMRGSVGVILDITARKRAEDDLRRAEEQVRSVVNTVIDGIITIDDRGVVQSCNPAAERLFGYPASEIVGQNVKMLMPEPYSLEHDGYLASYLRTGEAKIIGIGREVEGRREDGSTFPMDLAVSEFRVGESRHFTGIVRDITERKKAEDALKEADRRKDEFLATLAHELRNPLAPLRNALELLRRAGENASLIEKTRGMMERQVGQMVRLVDDLLDISRITRGKLQLRKERVELADVLNTAVETARPLVEASGHELTVTLPPHPVQVQADPVRLAQVFANLLNNAAKYTEKAGHIWLTAEYRGGEAVVSVRDTGIGIAPEHLPNIFRLFSQVGTALERSQGGLGIGLSLVRGLVELHGGAIKARSGGPGRGSEFTVHLPIVDEPAETPREPTPGGEQVRSGGKLRILVVDDLRDAADSMAMMLRTLGHETSTAYDGLEAVQTAAAFRPHVVLLDIGLPKMNGYDAARHIRNEPWGGNVALVALTGWGQEEDKRRSVEAGFDHHLTKPVAPATLEKLLALLMPQQ
jgi:PAS domain S-box-containing protein